MGKKLALPERKLHRIEEFGEHFPQAKEVMIEGTERPIQPQNSEQQRCHYPGTTHKWVPRRPTRKHLAVVDQDKRVLVLSRARAGTIHDKRLLDQSELPGGGFPRQIREELALSIPDQIPIEVD